MLTVNGVRRIKGVLNECGIAHCFRKVVANEFWKEFLIIPTELLVSYCAQLVFAHCSPACLPSSIVRSGKVAKDIIGFYLHGLLLLYAN